jgi:hypothetical protein
MKNRKRAPQNLQLPEAQKAKAIAKHLDDLLRAIDDFSGEPDAKGLTSGLAAFLPVLHLLQDVVECRSPIDLREIGQWTDCLRVLEDDYPNPGDDGVDYNDPYRFGDPDDPDSKGWDNGDDL